MTSEGVTRSKLEIEQMRLCVPTSRRGMLAPAFTPRTILLTAEERTPQPQRGKQEPTGSDTKWHYWKDLLKHSCRPDCSGLLLPQYAVVKARATGNPFPKPPE
jgi:hypothetical protein